MCQAIDRKGHANLFPWVNRWGGWSSQRAHPIGDGKAEAGVPLQ